MNIKYPLLFIFVSLFFSSSICVFAIEPNNNITVSDIFTDLNYYNDKEISVVRYYNVRFESFYLTDKKGNKIWLNRPSKNAKIENINEIHNNWARIKEVFKKSEADI